MSGDGVPEGAGRAGQEAARLVAAAQDWLRTSAPHLAPLDEHGEPCSCPLCRAVVSLRETDPATVSRWVDAAVAGVSTALAQAQAAAADLADRATAPAEAPPEGDDAGTSDAGTSDAGTSGADADGHAPDEPEVGHDGPERRVRRIPLDEPGTGAAPS
jgi:hypothetical protein